MEFLFELVLQLVFEVLAELGLRSLGAPFRADASPWLAALGYALLGAFAGGVSLWLFPALFLDAPWARRANLVLAPLAAGAAMAALGAWRERRGQRVLRLDRFVYGVVFAYSMAAVRFLLAH